mgnify:CR=1 FL=1
MGLIVTKDERLRTLEREKHELAAQLEKKSAELAYVAMMADVDIPTEEE